MAKSSRAPDNCEPRGHTASPDPTPNAIPADTITPPNNQSERIGSFIKNTTTRTKILGTAIALSLAAGVGGLVVSGQDETSHIPEYSELSADDPSGQNYTSYVLKVDEFKPPPLITPEDMQAAPPSIVAQLIAITPTELLESRDHFTLTTGDTAGFYMRYQIKFAIDQDQQVYVSGVGATWRKIQSNGKIDSTVIDNKELLGIGIVNIVEASAESSPANVQVVISEGKRVGHDECRVTTSFNTAVTERKFIDKDSPVKTTNRIPIPENWGVYEIINRLSGEQSMSPEEKAKRIAYAIATYAQTPALEMPEIFPSDSPLGPSECSLGLFTSTLSGQIAPLLTGALPGQSPSTTPTTMANTSKTSLPFPEATSLKGLLLPAENQIIHRDSASTVNASGDKSENQAYRYYLRHEFSNGIVANTTIDCATNRNRVPYVLIAIFGPPNGESRDIIMEEKSVRPDRVPAEGSNEEYSSFKQFLPAEFNPNGCIIDSNEEYLLPSREYFDALVGGITPYIKFRVDKYLDEGGYVESN